MTPLEKDIEKALGRMVGRHSGMCMKWVCPGWAGVPDRMILLPGGRVIFAELKRPSGSKVEERQKWWAAKLKELGFDHFFVFTHADVQKVEKAISSWSTLWSQLGPHLGVKEKRAVFTEAFMAALDGSASSKNNNALLEQLRSLASPSCRFCKYMKDEFTDPCDEFGSNCESCGKGCPCGQCKDGSHWEWGGPGGATT